MGEDGMLFALPQLPSCQDATAPVGGSLSFQTPSVGPDLEAQVGVKSLSYSSSWGTALSLNSL